MTTIVNNDWSVTVATVARGVTNYCTKTCISVTGFGKRDHFEMEKWSVEDEQLEKLVLTCTWFLCFSSNLMKTGNTI